MSDFKVGDRIIAHNVPERWSRVSGEHGCIVSDDWKLVGGYDEDVRFTVELDNTGPFYLGSSMMKHENISGENE